MEMSRTRIDTHGERYRDRQRQRGRKRERTRQQERVNPSIWQAMTCPAVKSSIRIVFDDTSPQTAPDS